MWCDPPLYLHFFDRELGRSVGYELTPDKAEFLIKRLLLGTTSSFYLGLSLAWESPSMTGRFLDLFLLLEQSKAIELVSNHPTIDEFLESRFALYQHDAGRYPMYFDHLVQSKARVIVPTQIKSSSATSELSKELSLWAASGDQSVARPILNHILLQLASRESQAITYAYFAPGLDAIKAPVGARNILRRRTSFGYTRHYQQYGTSEIATGVRGLEVFEALAGRFPCFDIIVLEFLLRFVGYGALLDSSWRNHGEFWAMTADWRGHGLHSEFRSELTLLVHCLAKCVQTTIRPEDRNKFSVRAAFLSRLRSAAARIHEPRNYVVPAFEQSLSLIRNLVLVLNREQDFASSYEEESMARGEHGCDVLLVVATDVERDTLLEHAKERTGRGHALRFGQRRTYYELGDVGGARLAMVQCEMGSGSPGASQATVSDAIDELRPNCAIMVGIAFGVDSEKQKIGEILVSRELQPYELQRVGTAKDGGMEIRPRGPRVPASTMVVGRLRAAGADWSGAPIKFELMLSGEKLVDNLDFRDQLRHFEPEAVGGEMEGAGLYTACSERKTDWVVVKAICDWADGKKRENKAERQRTAANEAIGFTLYAIAQRGFARITI